MDNATKEKILEIAGLCNGCLEGKSSHPSDGCYSCEDRGAYYGALKMAEWKQEQMVEKTVEWLGSIMHHVSKEDKHLVCNFTDFDELIDDYKQAMMEE